MQGLRPVCGAYIRRPMALKGSPFLSRLGLHQFSKRLFRVVRYDQNLLFAPRLLALLLRLRFSFDGHLSDDTLRAASFGESPGRGSNP